MSVQAVSAQAVQAKRPTFASDPEAAIAAYHQIGYHVEPDVWTQEQCHALIRAADRLPTAQDETFAPAMQPHRMEPAFLNALRNPKIVSIIERLVGGRASGLQTQFFFCKPGTPGFALHQDSYYVEAGREVFASAWSALRDITPEMGGLVAYPGSHQEPILPVENTGSDRDAGQDPNAQRLQTVLPEGYEPLALNVPMGSVVFLHGHVVHGSGQNASDRFRYSLLSTYIRCGESFRPGNYACRAEVNLYE